MAQTVKMHFGKEDVEKILSGGKFDPVFYAVTTGENVVLRVADIRQWTGLHPAPGETVKFTATMLLTNEG